jgi:hypothetical protein
MWSYFSRWIPFYQRWVSTIATAAILAPLIPFGYGLYLKKLPDSPSAHPHEGHKSDRQFVFPDWDPNWCKTSYSELNELCPPFSEKLELLGVNTRPDRDSDEALLRIRGKNEEKTVFLKTPFYLGYDSQGQLCFADENTGVYQALYDGIELSISWIGQKKQIFAHALEEKKGGGETGKLRIFKEHLRRLKFLGKDVLAEYLKRERKETLRLFDPIQQRLYVLLENDLLYFKEGRLFFAVDKGQRGDCFLSKLHCVEDTFIELVMWDQKGFQKEPLRIPLERPERLAPKVQTLLEGAKPFGYEAIWVKKATRMAMYVGDWLIEENGDWTRAQKAKLEEAIDGRFNAGLLHFSSMKKEGGKWVAQFEVFDGLHIQKETVRVTLDTKLSATAPTPPKAVAKIEKKGESKEGMRHFPPAVDPMLDDFDDELEDF